MEKDTASITHIASFLKTDQKSIPLFYKMACASSYFLYTLFFLYIPMLYFSVAGKRRRRHARSMIPGKPRPTRKLNLSLIPDDSPTPPGKWLLFFIIILSFLILTIVLVVEIIRTTPNPLVNILTALIGIPATVSGILQFPYFRKPTQQSLKAIEVLLD